jgi:hypothetical protein
MMEPSYHHEIWRQSGHQRRPEGGIVGVRKGWGLGLMWRVRLWAVTAGLAMISVGAAGQSGTRQKEQTHFTAEDAGVQHPVKIPAGVMAILRNDERVRNILKSENLRPEALPESWFSAAEVYLGAPHEADYIVAAEGPMVGANISPFWVVIHTAAGYKLALSLSAHDLEVGRTRAGSYRDLTIYSMTAMTITTVHFRFDGNEYKESSEKTENIK